MIFHFSTFINQKNNIRRNKIVDTFEKKMVIRIVHEIMPDFVDRFFGFN